MYKEKYVFEYYKKRTGFVRLYDPPRFLVKLIIGIQKRFKKRSWGVVVYGGFED